MWKIYKVINNLHGSVHHQKCHFLRVCLLKWNIWFQFSKYLQEPLSTRRTYNLFRVVNLGGWGRRKLWWGSYQKGARPNPFASDDDDVEDVAVVDPGPKDQTSFICDTDEGQGSQFSCACYTNICGVVVKRVDWEVLEDIWIFDTGGEQAVTKRKPWEILGVKYGFSFPNTCCVGQVWTLGVCI